MHPDAPAGGGGPGRFRVAKTPNPLGSRATGWSPQNRSKAVAGSGRLDSSYYAEVKPGTREETVDKESSVRILVERQRDGLYHWLIATLDGNQVCEGVYDPDTDFTAEICEDRTSAAAIKALEAQVTAAKGRDTGKPRADLEVREIIVIVKDDWLTRISYRRWGTFDWRRYLKPTAETLERRRQSRAAFNPDLIYPGDTFEVLGS